MASFRPCIKTAFTTITTSGCSISWCTPGKELRPGCDLAHSQVASRVQVVSLVESITEMHSKHGHVETLHHLVWRILWSWVSKWVNRVLATISSYLVCNSSIPQWYMDFRHTGVQIVANRIQTVGIKTLVCALPNLGLTPLRVVWPVLTTAFCFCPHQMALFYTVHCYIFLQDDAM